jgi:hypothetical protein
MEKALDDILGIEGVREALLISPAGETVFRAGGGPGSGPSFPDGGLEVGNFSGLTEADLFFEDVRLYVRLGPWGYLMVLMEHGAPAAMVRLNCDALAAVLGNAKNGRRRGRFFFKRKR